MSMTDKMIVCKRLENAVDWIREQELTGYCGRFTVKRESGVWQVKKSLKKF